MLSSRRRTSGRAIAEYIFIVVLLAVMFLGVIRVYENQIRDWFRCWNPGLDLGADAKLNEAITQEAEEAVEKQLSDLQQ